MKLQTPTRVLAASLMLGLLGGATAGGAQEEGGDGDEEYAAGLYLGECDALTEDAALYDLGDAELETEEFEDESEEGDAEGTPDVEDELEEEASDDETDVEGAIDGDEETEDGEQAAEEGDGGDDSEVEVAENAPLVWVASGASFDADLAELVETPFAVAITTGEGEGDEGGSDFLACGEFGGAVSGDRLVLPLRPQDDSELFGFAVLAQGEGEGLAEIYLSREAEGDEGDDGDGGEDGDEGEDDGEEEEPTPTN